MTINGNGWRVAIFLAGGLLASMATGGMAYVHVASAEARETAKIEALREDMKEHGALLREVLQRVARIEGSLAKDRR